MRAMRFPAGTLRAFTARALERAGLPRADAQTVAELMIEADLQGSDGHGIFRLPQYVRRIQAGGVNASPRIRVERVLPGEQSYGKYAERLRDGVPLPEPLVAALNELGDKLGIDKLKVPAG